MPIRIDRRRPIVMFVAIATAGTAMWLWARTPPASALESGLISLGLDQERTAVVLNLAAAFVAAGLAALVATRPLVVPWAAGTAWYLVMFVLPMALHNRPTTLPGEAVSPQSYWLALAALACSGCAAAGIGTAAGIGVTNIVSATRRLGRRPSRRELVTKVGVALLLGAAGFGILRTPGILLYGPWGGVVTAVKPVAEGDLVNFRYWSRAFGTYRQAIVVLPPEYSGSPQLAFPTLYLLHGSPGSDMDWARMGATQIVRQAQAAGHIPPAVIVYPDGDGTRGGAADHWADNYVPGDMMESDFIDDLIPSVEAHFRVVPDAKHRAIGGLSSGGYGAANLALRHPGEFGSAMIFAGDLAPEPTAFGGNQAELIANDPLRLALGPKSDASSAFFIGWGASDPYRAENSLFAQRLHARGYLVFTDVVAGAHSWTVWTQLLSAGLDQIGSQLGWPEPAQGL
jgi:enterochelin esterase-like enzyme